MEILDTKHKYGGPVNSFHEATIGVDSHESEELRAALKVINNYQKAAAVALKLDRIIKNADWHMFDFCVKKDKVIVEVRVGACG